MADDFAPRVILWAVVLVLLGSVFPEFVSREGPHKRAWVGLVFSLVIAAVALGWEPLGVLLPIVSTTKTGVSVAAVVGASGLSWLYLHKRSKRASRKGRKGLLNLRVDVPKARAAMDARLNRLAGLSGELLSVLQTKTTTSDEVRLANQTSERIRPIANRLRAEADGFKGEASELSAGLSRWLEIAERQRGLFGIDKEVPSLSEMMAAGSRALPDIRNVRDVFEKLGSTHDSMDAACGEVVEALDTVAEATDETVTTCESALRRIRRISEGLI